MTGAKGGPSKWATNHATTTAAAQAIIDGEANTRDEKTARLKAERLEREAQAEAALPVETRTATKPKAKPAARRVRPRT